MAGLIVFIMAVLTVIGTSLIKNVTMSDKTKNLIAVALSTVGGVVTDLSTKGFDFSQYQGLDILGTVLIIYGAAQVIYQFIMKGTTVETKLASTNVIPPAGNRGA